MNAQSELVGLPEEIIAKILEHVPSEPNEADPVTNHERIQQAREMIEDGRGMLGVAKEDDPEHDFISAEAPRFLYTLQLQAEISEMLGLGTGGIQIPEDLYQQIIDFTQVWSYHFAILCGAL